MKVTLYLKRHKVTGLYYFGKTTGNNIEKYNGSGVYWKRHLKIHGKDVETVWHSQFDCVNDAREFALLFSELHDIVKSKKFANEIPEDGESGWPKGVKRGPTSPQQKKILSDLLSGENNPMYGVKKDPVTMTAIGRLGLDTQMKLKSENSEWSDQKSKSCKDGWNDSRKMEHAERFTGNAPAIHSLTKEYLGLVPSTDVRWKTGEIMSPSKGIKRGPSKARGLPKQKKVCRIFDQMEMDLGNFTRWVNKQ